METLALVLIIITILALAIALYSFFRKKPEKTKLQKDLWSLEKEINSMRSQGIEDDAIIKRLSDMGWDEHVVELASHDLRRPNHSLEKLQNYADSRIRKGDSKEFLKETLLEAGWSEDVVDLVLKL
ncbi:hypothetical protein GF345_02445 [Candidatus Woesearchaeota archaeon]|nr:hypothetical protein [Candidatus Woesearchaeota archaeon]